MGACEHAKGPLYQDFGKTPHEVVRECLAANPGKSVADCQLINCFNDEYVLKGIRKITKEVTDILDDIGVRYVLEGGTLMGLLRFGAPLPWDDDADLEVLASELDPKFKIFQKKILAAGYTLKLNRGGFNVFTKEVSFWQVAFTKAKFLELLLDVDRTLSLSKMEKIWKGFDVGLDVFRMGPTSTGYTCFGSVFEHQVYTHEQLLPVGKGQFVRESMSIPNLPEDVVSAWYGGGDVMRDFVVTPPHGGYCGNPRFKDIRKSPKTYAYMVKYLKHIYGDDYKGPPPGILSY